MADLSVIWLGVSFLVVLAAYVFIRARYGYLTKTLLKQFSEEKARFEQAVQSAEAQCREQHLAVLAARDFAERVLQNVPLPVLVADGTGLLVSANSAALCILGKDIVQPGESITVWAGRQGLQYPSGQPVPPGAIPLTRAIREKQAIERAEFLLTAGQAPRIVELTSVPMHSTEGNQCLSVVAFLNDVTPLRRSQNQETIFMARIAAVARLSRQLAAASSSEQVYKIVTEGVLTLLPPNVARVRVALYGLDEGIKRLVLLSETPDRQSRRPRNRQQAPRSSLSFNAQSPLLWQLYVSRQHIVSADIAEDKRFSDMTTRSLLSTAEDIPAVSLLAVPFVLGKQVTGHLMLTSGHIGAFDEESLQEILASVTSLAAISQAKVLLGEQTHRQTVAMKALWAMSQVVASRQDAPEFVDKFTEQVRLVFDAELCLLSLWETASDGERRLHWMGKGYKDALLPGPTISQSPVGCTGCDHLTDEAALRSDSVMRTGIPNPSFGECRWRAFAGQSGIHSVLASPLRQGGEMLGALTIYRSGDAPFTPPQVQLLETFANLAAAAVRRVGIGDARSCD